MKMTLGDAQIVLQASRWSEEALYLKEFLHKHKLPRVVRLVRGQYLNLGVPSLSSPSMCQNLLLVNLGKRRRLLAQSVRFKDNKKVVSVGQKLAIPPEFEGFFEILSEDGRSVRCIESVAELCVRFPDSVLARENFRAFVSKSDDIDTIRDKSRIINEGETLILVGEVMGAKGKTHNRYLRCFDKNGENVYLPYDLKCRFSAIAKEDNISGVHSAANLLNKRLPLMVRLAHGKWPRAMKSTSNLSPEMRLLTIIDEDYIVGLTLSSKDAQAISIPQLALIKLQTVLNHEEISQMAEMDRLVNRCTELSSEFFDEMTIHDIAYSRDLRLNGEKGMATYQRRRVKRGSLKSGEALITNGPLGSLSPRDDYDEIEQIYDYVRGFAPLPRSAKGWKYENQPPSPQNDATTPPEPPPIDTIPSGRPPQRSTSMEMTPPTSPMASGPWESFNHQDLLFTPHHAAVGNGGSHTLQKESKKRQRNRHSVGDENFYMATVNNRYVKSATQTRQTAQKHRFFKHRILNGKSESNNMMSHPTSLTLSRSNVYSPLPGSTSTKPSSPSSFFHLRYKSMTNLAYAEYDTLDSSNSGGKTSGDSGGSRTLPEKRFRKLCRPKSLTNLVWGPNNSSRYSSMSISKENNGLVNTSPNASSATRPQVTVMHHSNKLGSGGIKKTGTLYL